MISTASPSSPSATPSLMAGKKSTRAPQQSIGGGGGGTAMGPTHCKKMVMMKANGRHQQATPVGPEMPSADVAGPIPLRRVSHAFDQQHNHHQSVKTLSAPPGYHHQQQQITGVFNQSLNATAPTAAVVSHNTDSSDCGSSSGLGGMGTPIKGEEGCSASCSTSSNNSMAADCPLDSHDRGSGGQIPEKLVGTEGVGREHTSVANGHRSLLASATLTPAMVSSSHHSATNSPVSANLMPIFHHSAAPQQQMLQQHQSFNAFVPPIPLLNTHQPNASQINSLHCSLSDGPSPLMAPPLQPPTVGVLPYAAVAAASNSVRPFSAASTVAASVGGGALPSPAALASKTGLKQLQHSPPPLCGRALYTMTCETNALASVSAAALTAGYHVTLDPSASAPPIIATVATKASVGAEFQQVAVPTSRNDGQTEQQQENNDASSREQKDKNDGGGTTTNNNGSSGSDQLTGNDPANAGDATANLPPGVPPEIAAAISGGNDLFVHIHLGDAIALAVGNDVQHIHGPATIRMVSQSTTPQSAIPMNVPEGHIVQQILDRQGNLSHIIMSQEPPAGVGPMLGQHVITATTVMSQIPSAPSTTAAQQRQMGYQLHPSAATVPLKHFRSNNSPPRSTDVSPLNDAVTLSRQKQHQGMATDSGAVYPSGVVPLLKWSDLQQHHQQQREHYQSQSGPFGRQHQQGRGHHTVPSPFNVYNLADSETVSSAPRHSPGFYVHGSTTMGGMDNRVGPSETLPTVAYHQNHQQQHSQHQHSAPGGADTFDSVNFPTQISSVIDDDEKERLRDTLSSIQPPILSKVTDRDAEVIWQVIDTSEAAASGGPFPQIDTSEFVYKLTLFDPVKHSQTFHKTEAGVNVLHLQQLNPGTEYMVAVRAELPERGINGHPSTFTSFRTLSTSPETPSLPKLVGRHQNCFSIQWKSPNCNGAPILSYCLQMAKGKMASFETVYDGAHEQTVVSGMDSGALYRFRVFARNEMGQSESSPVLTVYPERSDTGGRMPPAYHHHHVQHHYHAQQQQQHGGIVQRGAASVVGSSSVPSSAALPSHHHHGHNQPIRPPHSPNVYSTAARAIKLSWNPLSGADFTSLALEMADPLNTRGSTLFQAISPECYANSGTFAHITGLMPNHEYRFRLAAMTATGDVLYSEPISARTRHEQAPVVYNSKERRELDGTHHQQQHNDNRGTLTYQTTPRTSILVHDSADHHPPHHLFGQSSNHIKKLAVSSVQSSSKKQQKNVQQKPIAPQLSAEEQPEETTATSRAMLPKAPNCSAPTFSALTSESARVAWKLVKSAEDGGTKGTVTEGGENKGKTAKSTSSTSALIFELQRVDKQQPIMVYSGVGTDFEYNGLRPVEHMQLRVRAVLLDTEGRRLEGDWSPVGSTCTLCAPPSAPQNLRLSSEFDIAVGSGESSSKATTAFHEDGQWHSVGICWEAPAQMNGAIVGGYSIRIQRFDLSSSAGVTKSADANNEKASDEQMHHISGTECRFNMQHLRPAQLYRLAVTAQSDAGPSPKSDILEYRSPPGVPEKPRNVHIEAISTTELRLSWMEPSTANGSPIVSYHVNCFRLYSNSRHQLQNNLAVATAFSSSKRQLVSQQIAPGSQRLLIIQSLEAETEYELTIEAENSVGKGDRVIIRQKTLVEPPEPPQIFLAQATANSLKLKWSDGGENNSSIGANGHGNYYYYLERENENGTYSPVYEGELRTARLKGLREQSVHHFRIRASVSKGLLLGPWSHRFSFQTTKLPPPAPKQAPIVAEQMQDHFQFEWNSVRFRDQNGIGTGGEETPLDGEQQRSEFVYRLQMAPKVGSSVKEKAAVEVWKTIFEDKLTQTPPIYVHNASQQPRQVRLFVVQRFVDTNGRTIEELVSAPSPIAVFSSLKTPNESPKKRNLQSQQPQQGMSSNKATGSAVVGRKSANPYPLPKETKMSLGKKVRRMASWLRKTVSEKDCALIVLAIFVILAFGIAILLNNFYLN